MAAMERLVEVGKVRFIGVSNFTLAELRCAQSVLSTTRIVSNQVRYSLVDRTPEEGLLQYCNAYQISVLAFSPLATGFGRMRRCDPDDVLGHVAATVGKTRAQVALSWCVSHAAVIAIFKADKVEHVRENCAASGWELSAEQRQRLETPLQQPESPGAIPEETGAARFTICRPQSGKRNRYGRHLGKDCEPPSRRI
jgi:diketogulonate reductase-like aldo/keto reductase